MTREDARCFLTVLASDTRLDKIEQDTLLDISGFICSDTFEPCKGGFSFSSCDTCEHKKGV